MPASRLLEAIDKLEEAVKRSQREKAIAPLVKKLEKKMAAAFRAQGKSFARRLKALEKKWPVREASSPGAPDWEPAFDGAAKETVLAFEGPIEEAIAKALEAGGHYRIATLKADIAFDLKNPRAAAYMKEHGAEMVTKINETTRSAINTIVKQAVDEGWSYGRTAKAITDRYGEFAVGKPQQHIESRAHLVAVTETGNAYEEGNLEAARQIAAAGIEMEKGWVNMGDSRVSDGCVTNAAAGWIALEKSFPSGHDRPLRFPGCRCYLDVRVKRQAKTKAKASAA